MPTSAFPAVLAALVDAAQNALDPNVVRVTYGYDITSSEGDFLMFGVDDPTATSSAIGSWSQSVATMSANRPRDESGTVNCAAASANGNTDGLRAALEAAHAYVAAVETFLRADPSLGLSATFPGRITIEIGEAGTPFMTQDEYGSSALVVFTVNYVIRI